LCWGGRVPLLGLLLQAALNNLLVELLHEFPHGSRVHPGQHDKVLSGDVGVFNYSPPRGVLLGRKTNAAALGWGGEGEGRRVEEEMLGIVFVCGGGQVDVVVPQDSLLAAVK